MGITQKCLFKHHVLFRLFICFKSPCSMYNQNCIKVQYTVHFNIFQYQVNSITLLLFINHSTYVIMFFRCSLLNLLFVYDASSLFISHLIEYTLHKNTNTHYYTHTFKVKILVKVLICYHQYKLTDAEESFDIRMLKFCYLYCDLLDNG